MPKVIVDWLYVAVFAFVGTIMAALPLGIVWLLAPRADLPQKTLTYESGVIPFGQAWAQFNVRYYLFALIFVVFDVEVIYLYPWAVVFRQLEVFGLVEMGIFVGLVGIAYVYDWKRGGLEWD